MNLEKHLEVLRRKHFELEEIISHEQRQVASQGLEIKKLKKKKLHIKDRIREVSLRGY